MLDPLLPRLKKEIEARLAELRPLVAEVEQLENAKAALLDGTPAAIASAAATARAARGASPARAARPASSRRAAPRAAAATDASGEEGSGRAARGANRDAILTLVEERPGVSVSEIASVTKIAKATVATTVSKLKRDGVLADEAGGVKLASRAPVTIASALPTGADEAPGADEDEEWDAADPKGGARADAVA